MESKYLEYKDEIVSSNKSYKENIRLRQIGKNNNFKINEYGIFKVNKDTEEIIVLNTEKELYDILNEKYKLPEERN